MRGKRPRQKKAPVARGAAEPSPAADIRGNGERVGVKHNHRIGSCEGVLVASAEGVRFETEHKDTFFAPYAELEELSFDDDKLTLKVLNGREYDFIDCEGRIREPVMQIRSTRLAGLALTCHQVGDAGPRSSQSIIDSMVAATSRARSADSRLPGSNRGQTSSGRRRSNNPGPQRNDPTSRVRPEGSRRLASNHVRPAGTRWPWTSRVRREGARCPATNHDP